MHPGRDQIIVNTRCDHTPHTPGSRLMSDAPIRDKWLCPRCPHHITDCVILKFQNILHQLRVGTEPGMWHSRSGSGEYSPMMSDGRGSGASVVTGHLSASHPMTSGGAGTIQGLLCDQWHWHHQGWGSLIASRSFFSVNHFNQNFDRRSWFSVLWWALTIK